MISTSLFFPVKGQTIQYLIGNEKAPEDIPIVYGVDIISKNGLNLYGISFSPNGDELVFAERENGLYYMQKVNDKWTKPQIMDASKNSLTHIMYPKFSPDGDFISFVDGNSKTHGHGDIFKIEKLADNKWSEPIKFPAPINSKYRDAGHGFSSNGSVYFSSGRFDKDLPHADIYLAKNVRDSIIVELLPEFSQFAVHTDEECLYVSPDESYIIVDSWHVKSKRKQDLFIAFKKDDNTWTDLIRLNNKINTNEMEGIPFVTSDNKFLFFRRSTSSGAKIFWVSTKEVFTPYLNLAIPDFYQKVNVEFKIPILKNTFRDFDGEIVDYKLKPYDKEELPEWILFDSENLTITGKTSEPQILRLELIAIDNDKNRKSSDFKIVIE